MGIDRKWSTLMALTALGIAQMAGAQTVAAPPCLSPAELRGLIGYGLPVAMTAAIAVCKPRLAPENFLASDGAAIVDRYAVGKPAAWPMAKAAALKLSTANDRIIAGPLRNLPDAALQPIAEGLVIQAITHELPVDACAPFEHLARLLAPLPPENTVELLSYFVTMTSKPDKPGTLPGAGHHHHALTVCPAGN